MTEKIRIGVFAIEIVGLCEVGGVPVSCPVELLARYGKALEEFDKVQKELNRLVDEQQPDDMREPEMDSDGFPVGPHHA